MPYIIKIGEAKNIGLFLNLYTLQAALFGMNG